MSNVENTISAEIAMLKQVRQKAPAMQKLFKDHPQAVGETYFEHMGTAFTFAARLLGASLACFVHGLFPFLFTSTGSTTVKRLYQGMIAARPAQRGAQPRLERAGIAAAVDQQILRRDVAGLG